MIPDDFELMAYVDGELDAQTSKRVAEAVEADPALRAKVEALIESRDVARAAYGAAAAAPLSPALSEMMDDLRQDLKTPEQAPVWSTPDSLSSGSAGLLSWGQSRIAALTGIGFVVGAAAVWIGMSQIQPNSVLVLTDTNELVLSSQAQRLLSETPAGGQLDSIHVQTSFLASDGTACRQFTASDRTGIACLDQQSWRLVILTDTPNDTQFQAAGGSTALAVATARLGVSKVLSEEEEAARIENGWRPLKD